MGLASLAPWVCAGDWGWDGFPAQWVARSYSCSHQRADSSGPAGRAERGWPTLSCVAKFVCVYFGSFAQHGNKCALPPAAVSDLHGGGVVAVVMGVGCVCVSVCVCLYVYIYVYMCTCVCVCVCDCMCILSHFSHV